MIHAPLLLRARTFRLPLSKWVTCSLAIVLYATCGLAVIEYLAGSVPLSWLGNINLVGYCAAMLMIVSLVEKTPRGVLIAGAALIAVNSTGALVVVLAFAIYLYRHNRVVIGLLVCASILVICANQGWSYMQRLQIWIAAIEHPDVNLPFLAIHAHNLFVEAYRLLGVPGLLLVIADAALVATVLIIGKTNASIGALIFLTISSMVDYIYWYPGVVEVVVLYLIWSVSSRCDYA